MARRTEPQAWLKTFLPWLLAVFVVTAAVYLNSLPNSFNLDDNAIIESNPLIRSLSNLPRIFASNYWANTPYEKGVLLYRPLVIASFSADYSVWGDNPLGFHLTNLVINGINAVLVLVLLAILLGDSVRPLHLTLAALLFSLHPVHTEAINMVVGRTELLAAMFGLLTFILYLRGWPRTAFVSFFLALLSKEIAVTIPLLIFLHQWLFKEAVPASAQGSQGSNVRPKGIQFLGAPASLPAGLGHYLIFGGVLAAYLVIRFVVLRGFVSVHQTGILDKQTLLQRTCTVIQVMGYYLKLLVLPHPLSPDYSDVALPQTPLTPWVWVSVSVIAVLLYLAWYLRKAASMVSFAILWFFVTILPVSNIISIGAFLGERFLYLPSVSLALLGSGLFRQIFCQRGRTGRTRQTMAVTAFVCVLSSFTGITFNRNYDWKDANTLWSQVLAYQPENPRANYHVAVMYDDLKDYQKALAFYAKATQFYPRHNWNPDTKTLRSVKQRVSVIYYEMALKSYKEGGFQEAQDLCKQALLNDGSNAPAYVIQGNCHVREGDIVRAAEDYRAALKADPSQFEAQENLKRVEPLLPGSANPTPTH